MNNDNSVTKALGDSLLRNALAAKPAPEHELFKLRNEVSLLKQEIQVLRQMLIDNAIGK